MVVDPLQGRVGEHHVEILAEPIRDVALLEGEPGHLRKSDLRPGQHGRRRVDADRLFRLEFLVEDLREVSRAAPQVDHASTGDGMAQHEEVVEGLLPLRAESFVLVWAPPIDRSHGHRTHVLVRPKTLAVLGSYAA